MTNCSILAGNSAAPMASPRKLSRWSGSDDSAQGIRLKRSKRTYPQCKSGLERYRVQVQDPKRYKRYFVGTWRVKVGGLVKWAENFHDLPNGASMYSARNGLV